MLMQLLEQDTDFKKYLINLSELNSFDFTMNILKKLQKYKIQKYCLIFIRERENMKKLWQLLVNLSKKNKEIKIYKDINNISILNQENYNVIIVPREIFMQLNKLRLIGQLLIMIRIYI